MVSSIDRLVGSDQFKLLLTLVETRSFSGAAAQLGITQPSVSQQVKRLESIVGRPLFRRTRAGVVPTADGDAVLIYAKAMQALTKDLQHYFDGTAAHARISIGMSEDFVRTALPSILWLFMHEHPSVEMRIISGSYEMLTSALEAHAVDLVVMRRYARIGDSSLLWREPGAWVGSPDLSAPIKDPVPLVLPVAPNPVRETLIDALRAQGRTWRIRFESPSLASIEAAMQARLGMCYAPRSMRLHGVEPLDLDRYGLPPLPDVEFVMVEADHRMTGAVGAFAEVLRQVASSTFRKDSCGP